MAVTIAQICDALESVLSTATGMSVSESYDELSEGIGAADLPLIQVYWQDLMMDPSGGTDRTTFQAVIRHKRMTFHVDLYAAQRAQLDENMKSLVDMTDALLDVFEVQNTKPYFALAGIKAWQLQGATRAIFEYTSGPMGAVHYLGVRFVLTIHVY